MVLQEVDDLKWVKDIKINLMPNKLYYFTPGLSMDEMKTFQKKFNTLSLECLYSVDVDFFNLIIKRLEIIESEKIQFTSSENMVEEPYLLYFETNNNGEIVGWQNVIKNYRQMWDNNKEIFNLDSLESIKRFHTWTAICNDDYYIDARKLL